ncbi:putative photosynthetic complex assembly protein PuhE [Alterisphingorhabdus coralli]|uniref:Photosynthetic complex assembly protein PuhE n=1 Tax=Alterisphingorhabdus coralli TaxID=3071408 RepID=A0AA97F599_9SPHN|nr:putative photosynthetic complex assembly protein PuhE [Parasphingorhabdus sp. SCSIO 66989]WOE74544.1 putative photosynthetic complex assembly protein PuhE [Parasphingorhabdus sp. SCSIO 66989]
MVGFSDLALAMIVVTALWFVSTGLVATLNHRHRQSFARSLIIAGGCGIGGLALLVFSSTTDAVWAVYTSFLAGLLIWSWHEISFLTGAVAGSHREPCPENATGWERFSLATMALIHHEVALAMTAGLLLSLAWFTENSTGALTFALLLIFRLSSKFNIYRGVPNMSDELLPSHLDYLKSYFGPRRLRPMLIVTILAILGLAAYFGFTAFTASATSDIVQATLLGGLCLLAALEHFFFIIPFRDSALWQWALEARDKQRYDYK